ncbi:siderophore ABC transporter substrate-binding protein [Staphylococcus simulans]|uniref:ferrated catecholamine ABC transporter substrate-binding lipoprotein SstD n=1 Tax=Staphylococcus simulans TaxID=1286 RepID=UPI001E52031C|nr:siderophore ABC transporter substrate-binding protein [Staphylococcus simulans]MCD8914144.1 siderophore ABC transporter substrate-binding protein [Staphylococcus simulans]
MKKLGLFILVSVMFLLAACGNGSDQKESSEKGTSDKKTVKIENSYKLNGKDPKGSDAKQVKDTVEVPVNPKNAVVLDYGALDTLKALGVADKVKATPKGEDNSTLPDFLKEFKDEKYLNTGSLKEVNFDKVAQAKPEVIFISNRTANQKNLDEFKKAAPKAKVVYVGADDKDYMNSVKKNAENLGKIYDKEDKAKELNKKLDKKVADMKAKTKDFDKSVMYLLVNEGELSTFGPKERFGSLVYNTLGFKPADEKIKASAHGQNVTNEYVNEKNPGVIIAMDRGQAIGGKYTAKQVLGNDVIKNVKAIKDDQVYEVDPKLWYFASGSTTTTMKQIDELKDIVK